MATKDSSFRGALGGAVPIEAKMVGEAGEIEGYGSVFGVVDKGNDIVMPGAFTQSLATRPASGVKMLWQHDTAQPIGVWSEIREDERGLYCKGRLLLDVQGGREAYALLKAGAVDGLSIGYRTTADDHDREAGTRRIIKAELMEVSVVTFPMNAAATVSLVKSDGTLAAPKEFEAYLRDAGLSRQQAKAFMAHGYKSLNNLRDAGDGDVSGILGALRGAREALT